MIHPILLYGDDALTQKSEDYPLKVDMDTSQLNELIYDMYETMHKANGVGLSAIQIGIPYRIFVIEAHLDQENFHFRGLFINPVIKREFGSLVKHPEGCLSVPFLTASVERKESIEIEYYDQDLNFHTETFSGFEARIIQHEYDHLNGILYVNKLDRLWKKALERPLEIIKQRLIENVPYLSK